jgi:uncharacterized protein YyaL (SSP411 family)
MITRFWDDVDGGFFDSPAPAGVAGEAGESAPIGVAGEAGESAPTGVAGEAGGLPRLKDAFDGAELAGNSIAAEVLWRLSSLLERPAWRDLATRAFEFHARRISSAPWAMPRMVAAMERAVAAPMHLVIAGEQDAADPRALVAIFESRLRPDTDLVMVTCTTRAALESLVPWAAALPARDGRATAYLCVDHACRQPVQHPAELAALLDA